MTTIQLQVKDGTLYYPETVVDEFGEPAPIVLCVYPAGDCDTVKWPLTTAGRKNLASALFDDVETGRINDDDVILLPNGKPASRYVS